MPSSFDVAPHEHVLRRRRALVKSHAGHAGEATRDAHGAHTRLALDSTPRRKTRSLLLSGSRPGKRARSDGAPFMMPSE